MVGHASERSRRYGREVEDSPKTQETDESEKIEVQEEDLREPRESEGASESGNDVESRLRKVMDDLETQERLEEPVSHRMERALKRLEDVEFSQEEQVEDVQGSESGNHEIQEESIEEPECDSTEIRERMARDSESGSQERLEDTVDEPDYKSTKIREDKVRDSEPESQENPDSHNDVLPDDRKMGFESKKDFDGALENFPEIELRKDFEERYDDVDRYYERIENGETPEKPDLVNEIERLEIRRQFEEENDGLPDVKIDSMRDFDELREKYEGQVEVSEKDYEEVRKYFDIRNESGKNQHQLAEEYGCSQSKISNIRRGVETGAIKELRMREEERIIQDWADSRDTNPKPNDTPDIERARRELSIDESGLQKIQGPAVREAFQDIRESKEVSRISLEDALEKMIISSNRESRMRMSDLSSSGLTPEEIEKVKSALDEHRVKIQDTLEQRTGIEKVRIGIARERVYIWTPDMTPNDMINAWHDQYFYMNGRDMSDISDKVARRLELGDSRRERLKNLNDLEKQIMDYKPPSDPIKIDGDRSRMPGEALNIQRDVLGIQNRDLEGRVTKVTGINGHGGIANPKFPEGRRLETWRAGLMGSILSDGHIRSDDSIVEYYEENLERLQRFRNSLNEVGDFTNEPSFDYRSNLYRLKLPSPYGKALIYWGVPAGDKAINNPGLPSDYRTWSPETSSNYISEMTSEESNITPGCCRWPRSNVIKVGEKKSETYQQEGTISKKEINFIRDIGKTRSGDFDGMITVPYGLVDDLRSHSNPEVAMTAQRLDNTIQNNRNNLLDCEKELCSTLGIEVIVTPKEVSIYDSGRVSVKWEGRTTSAATFRMGIICPPNHPEKEVVLKRWMDTRNPEKIKSALNEIENDGFDIPEEWNNYRIEKTGG